VNEDPARHGVQLGEQFFPGYRNPNGAGYVAFYAVPTDGADLKPKVVASDKADNETAVTIALSVVERSFPSDTIELTDAFMERKVGEPLGGSSEGAVLDRYLEINREMRKKNDATIAEVCADSSDDRLWDGAFLQLPNSHKGADFGEKRSYSYKGRTVDRQTHLGLDLASVAHAPVPAANDGVVAFADDLGIYGKTVIIDHGLGLFSLYGHLSEIAIEKGRPVARGETIGNTGVTGLAGGDHLHFSTLVSGVFVDPLEWFDEKWIREHVDAKLEPAAAEDAAPAAE